MLRMPEGIHGEEQINKNPSEKGGGKRPMKCCGWSTIAPGFMATFRVPWPLLHLEMVPLVLTVTCHHFKRGAFVTSLDHADF